MKKRTMKIMDMTEGKPARLILVFANAIAAIGATSAIYGLLVNCPLYS